MVTADVDFCPQCDAYLAWDQPGGARPAGAVPQRSAPSKAAPRAEDPRPAAGATKTDAGPEVAQQPDAPQPAASLPVITIPPWPFDDEPATASAVDGDPVAMLPGRAAPKAPPSGVSPSAARSSGGGTGVRCASCGAWNTAGRHFCTSCGAEIVAAAPQPSAAAPRPAAATFRRRSGGGRIVAVVVVVAIVLALLVGGYLLRDPLASFAASAVDRVFGVGAVNPSKVTASGSASGHPATAAHDGASNIAWEAAQPGPATGESLTFSFRKPFRLVVLQVLPGAATDQQTFLKNGRPTELRVTIERSGAPSVVRTMHLDDQPGPQRLDLGVDQVQTVRVTVLQSMVPPNARVAIAEVEFSGR
ncbi:hypothetical protein [uncultured Amnibacterium sp.]|uniref:NADase-type glycan-binding domain-containing protein n=1 Tax=uncultured Amnibacterium sp. TaxID=1631851 RepID=UPI0035CBBBB3